MTLPSPRHPARGVAGALLLIVAGAAMAAEPPAGTPEDLLRDARFRSAYAAALGPKAKLPWIARLSNSALLRTHRFESVDYQVASRCKPHDCAEHNLLLLYAPASGKVYGQLHERGHVTLLGAPGPALSQELGRLWKREFRSQ